MCAEDGWSREGRLQRRNSEKESQLVKDGKCLAKVMSLLYEDVGVIFCGKMVALLRIYVLFYWSMLSIDTDIHSPEDADELLKAVIKLWVTIRGYSLTAAWLRSTKSTSFQQQEKALRKDLRLQQAD